MSDDKRELLLYLIDVAQKTEGAGVWHALFSDLYLREEQRETDATDATTAEARKKSLESLELSVRPYNCIKDMLRWQVRGDCFDLRGNVTVGEILDTGEWHRCRNMGKASYAEVAVSLAAVVGKKTLFASNFWNRTASVYRNRAARELL